MGKITVRLAENAEGERIRQLVERQHGLVAPFLRWDNISPYWLAADMDGQMLGAIQTCPSRPVGRLEMLSVEPGLKKAVRARVVRELAFAGMACLRHNGASQVQMFIASELEEFRSVLARRGAEVLDTGFMLSKRIA